MKSFKNEEKSDANIPLWRYEKSEGIDRLLCP
jgi:hypothetical protein